MKKKKEKARLEKEAQEAKQKADRIAAEGIVAFFQLVQS